MRAARVARSKNTTASNASPSDTIRYPVWNRINRSSDNHVWTAEECFPFCSGNRNGPFATLSNVASTLPVVAAV
jgi:hypothetical protein